MKSYLQRFLLILAKINLYLQENDSAFIFFISPLTGIAAGFSAVFFVYLIKFFQFLFFIKLKLILFFLHKYYVILVPTLGGIITGPIIYFFAKEAKGHGVPEVMLAVHKEGGKIRRRVASIKALASAICIGSGGSVGREGPIVQIASSIGSSIAQTFNLSTEKIKVLVACGAAGGISATFNAPLAGIFFSMEVILGRYSTRLLSSIIFSSVSAAIVSRRFLGNHPAFNVPDYKLNSVYEIFFYIILGFLCALAAFIYVKVLYFFEDYFEKIRIKEYLKPAIGGILLGLLGLFLPQVFGSGYKIIEIALFGKIGLVVVTILIFAKILATSLTLGSGNSGGIFAPALFIGAMVGESFGKLIYTLFPTFAFPPGAAALVAMGAVFSGAAFAPVTAILIVFEMTNNYLIILPLMITCIISFIFVSLLSKHSIYTLKLKRKGFDVSKLLRIDILENTKVSEAMIKNIISVSEDTKVKDAGLKIKETRHRGFPVLDPERKLFGMVTYKDINKALRQGQKEILVKDICTQNLEVCYPDENLKDALEKLGEKNVGRLPVVKKNNPKEIIGLLTRKSIIECYHQIAQKAKEMYEETQKV